MPDRRAVRRLFGCVGFVEPVLEDRGDRAVAGRADVVAAPAGGLEAGRRRNSLASRRMPRHERKPCSGCGFAFMIASNSAIVAGPILAASRIMRGRRPFGVAAMRARHVLGDRGVPVAHGGDRMAGDPLALVEDLDRRAR